MCVLEFAVAHCDNVLSFQNALPAILTAAIDPAVRRAGMIAVCTMIGPVPEAGGQIVATTWVSFFVFLSFFRSLPGFFVLSPIFQPSIRGFCQYSSFLAGLA